jgi:uncharacterized coiled-coil protein SlyX
MKQQLEQRLEELKREMATGQKVLGELEARGVTMRESLLRISGAIQVLEEELAKSAPASAPAVVPARAAA